jgi:hypothetical protein
MMRRWVAETQESEHVAAAEPGPGRIGSMYNHL